MGTSASPEKSGSPHKLVADENQRKLPFSFMLLGATPAAKAIDKLVLALNQYDPFTYFSHNENLNPADTINVHHFVKLFTRNPYGLTKSEATILFNALDTTGNKVIYIYNLLAVLDTHAIERKFDELPVAYNEHADSEVR